MTLYSEVQHVFCAILEKEIVFNAKGFHHLHYKPDGTSRTVEERIYKLKLFPLVIPVIKNATGIYEERDILIPKNRKKGSERIKAKQYALVGLVGIKNPVEIRVIILDIENSQHPIFWSVMKH